MAVSQEEVVRRSNLAALRSSGDRLSVNWDCSTEMDPSEIADYASDSLITVGTGGVIQFSVVQLSPGVLETVPETCGWCLGDKLEEPGLFKRIPGRVMGVGR